MSRKKYCICRKSHGNDAMVQCDKCLEWFHYKCLKISASSFDQDKDWFCPECLRTSRQCGRPECCLEARKNSKYCSDNCGRTFNEERYKRFFLPKWEELERKHSKVRVAKMLELERLENEQEQVASLICRLKEEREELERSINTIKEEAKALGAEANHNKEQQGDDSDEEEEEENTTSDQSKSFCPACGTEPTADKYFKHLVNCYKKQEGSFVSYSTFENKEPGIYCTKMVDKKRGWYCPNIAIICPTHKNYNVGKDEICGSPLVDYQDTIVPDGNYCLKLKKDCTLHYNWDLFRLASKDYAIAEAYQRQQRIQEETFRTQESLNDTYGGVVGVMLHNTVDHRPTEEPEDQEMIDIQTPD